MAFGATLNMEKFTSKDLFEIEKHGLSLQKVEQNLQTFERGIPFTELIAPATLESGIWKLSENELKFYGEKYDRQNLEVIKFVPASGAATRMFKDLQSFLQDLQGFRNLVGLDESINAFFRNLPKFPFYEKLLSATKIHFPDMDNFSEGEKNRVLLKTLLEEDKLNFCNFPKGLVPFHKYSGETRTAFKEHLVEVARYGSKGGLAKLHFTVAEEHLEKFETEFHQIKGDLEKRTGIQFDPTFSFQHKNTDTLAVDMENRPFRDENGNLCFRTAGHGALLQNLNQIDADIIFIKNIDNVSTENNLPIISTYKKALAGILMELQTEAFALLNDLQGFQNLVGLNDSNKPTRSKKDFPGASRQVFTEISEKTIKRAKSFLKENLNVLHEPKSLAELIDLLNRPIRVCGMVKNSGAPGGGPFWVKDGKGDTSLQIVETAQINMENHEQKEILEKATHFNPVDLVCGVKNYKGEKFDLVEFSNPNRGFITQKSANGRDLKALELPGLWNGAMEYWNTVFMEVPLETFNPVKTVLDLLKPEHQTC